MRRLPIRLKLAVALALPLLALVIVTAIAVRATADTANDTWLIVLTVATVGAAVLLAFVVSRSITEPLRSLTAQAKDMAEHQLPDAVVESGGEKVRAFSTNSATRWARSAATDPSTVAGWTSRRVTRW